MDRPLIMHLTDNLGHPGGVEVFISSMMSALSGRVESVYYNTADGRFCRNAEDVLNYSANSRPATAGLHRLCRITQESQPDIIHMHWPTAMVHGHFARLLCRSSAKTVAHFHGMVGEPTNINSLLHPRRLLRHRMQSHIIRRCASVISCSHANAGAAADHWHLSPDCVRVLPNPVDVQMWSSAEPDTSFRENVGAGPNDILFTFVGRLGPVKGLDVLCEAVGLIGEDVNLRVAIIGPGDRHQFDSHLTRPDRITFAGPVEHHDLAGLLKASDAFVLPSRWEGLPIVILEAMAAGLPVVATDVGGVAEAVEDGVTGIVVPAEDPDALALALERLAQSPQQRAEMGHNARQRAERFDLRVVAERLSDIYNGILND